MAAPVKIGLAYEGDRDSLVLRVLLQRVLESHQMPFEIVRSIKAGTGITGYVRVYIKVFFVEHGADIAIFLTDHDEVEDRRKRIESEISKVKPGYLPFSVIALPNPHLEKWLVVDQNAVKPLFGLDHTKELPGGHLQPKNQLEYIRTFRDGIQLTSYEAYEKLAATLDIATVRRMCPEFNRFCEDIVRACSSVQEDRRV